MARGGERVRAHPGDIRLQTSDILLLDAGPAFKGQNSDSKYFSLVIELENSNPPRYLHTGICAALVITAFVLYATEVLDIVVGAAISVAVMLVTGCLSAEQARRAIRWVSARCAGWLRRLPALPGVPAGAARARDAG